MESSPMTGQAIRTDMPPSNSLSCRLSAFLALAMRAATAGVLRIIGAIFSRLNWRAASWVGQMIFMTRGMQVARCPSTLRISASVLTVRAGPQKATARYLRLVAMRAGSTM